MTNDERRTTGNEPARWLLLVHQLPAEPSKLRVKIWRRLQSVGAAAVKNSVYVLPNSAERREDFEWIRGEIVALGGEAIVFTADTIDELSSDEVVNTFITARQNDWDELSKGAGALREKLEAEPSDRDLALLERELKALRSRVAQIEEIDYFRTPGRVDVIEEIDRMELLFESEPVSGGTALARRSVADFKNRRWLTRPHPGVDRMASAWLLRRFIDPRAFFEFGDRIAAGGRVVPFDMFGVDFGHQGELCTFEVLQESFELRERALERIGRIVHDLDLRSEFAADSETAAIGRMVAGLRESIADDGRLLQQGMTLFEALYLSFASEEAARR